MTTVKPKPKNGKSPEVSIPIPTIEYSDTEDGDKTGQSSKTDVKLKDTVLDIESGNPNLLKPPPKTRSQRLRKKKSTNQKLKESDKNLKATGDKKDGLQKGPIPKIQVEPSATSTIITTDTNPQADAETDREMLQSNYWKTPGHYAQAIHRTTKFLYLFLKAIGRFPSTTTTINRKLYLHKINWNWKKIQTMYFHHVTVIMVITLLLGLLNCFLIAFRVDVNLKGRFGKVIADKIQTRELAVLHRNFIMFVTVGANIINGVACSGFFYLKRKVFPNYMGCFSRNLQVTQLDATPFVKCEINKNIVIVCLGAAVMLILALTNFGQAFRGGSTLLAVLLFRLFVPDMLLPIDDDNNFSMTFYVLQGIGMILMVASFLWSKSFIVLYISHARLLFNAAVYWNGRLYNSMVETENPFGNFTERTTLSLLFKDHCILLDLLDGTNDAFEGILESCYMTEAVVLPFQVYFIYRSCKYGYNHELSLIEKDYFIRPYEFVNALLLIIPSIYFFLTINLISGDVSSEFQTGLEILRRKSLIGRTTDQELLYLLSMYSSFNAPDPIELGGGGFAGVNKELLVGSLGVLVFLTLIIAQYYPTFDYSRRNEKGHVDLGIREEIGRMFEVLEGLCPNHWRTVC